MNNNNDNNLYKDMMKQVTADESLIEETKMLMQAGKAPKLNPLMVQALPLAAALLLVIGGGSTFAVLHHNRGNVEDIIQPPMFSDVTESDTKAPSSTKPPKTSEKPAKSTEPELTGEPATIGEIGTAEPSVTEVVQTNKPQQTNKPKANKPVIQSNQPLKIDEYDHYKSPRNCINCGAHHWQDGDICGRCEEIIDFPTNRSMLANPANLIQNATVRTMNEPYEHKFAWAMLLSGSYVMGISNDSINFHAYDHTPLLSLDFYIFADDEIIIEPIVHPKVVFDYNYNAETGKFSFTANTTKVPDGDFFFELLIIGEGVVSIINIVNIEGITFDTIFDGKSMGWRHRQSYYS